MIIPRRQGVRDLMFKMPDGGKEPGTSCKNYFTNRWEFLLHYTHFVFVSLQFYLDQIWYSCGNHIWKIFWKRVANKKIKYVSRDKILWDLWSIFPPGPTLRISWRPWVASWTEALFAITSLLWTHWLNKYDKTTNLIIFFYVVVQFCLAGITDPANEVGSRGTLDRCSMYFHCN